MSIDNVVYPCGFLKPMGTPKFFIVFCLVTLHLDVPTTFLSQRLDHKFWSIGRTDAHVLKSCPGFCLFVFQPYLR